MTSAYNFINSQVCDIAFSLIFWKVETASQQCSYVVKRCYCKYFEDSSCTDMQLTHQNCETRLRQILQWNYSFVLKNWFCLDTWVRMEQRWTFCTIGLVGTKVDEKTYRSCVLLTQMILEKNKKEEGLGSHNRFNNDVNKSNGRVNCMLLAYVLVLLTSYEHPLQRVLDQF